MPEPERWIDLEKRNRLMAKCVPESFISSGWGEDRTGPAEFKIDTSKVPVGTNIAALFADPQRFASMTADQVAEVLATEQGRVQSARLLVAVDEFFDGNGDPGSIAVNLSNTPAHPGLNVLRDTLTAIRSRPDVLDVQIEVIDWPNPLMTVDDREWPTAEAIFIWTTASPEYVEEWVKPLHADGFGELANAEAVALGGPVLTPGLRIYVVAWD